jgi:hypothetical protein
MRFLWPDLETVVPVSKFALGTPLGSEEAQGHLQKVGSARFSRRSSTMKHPNAALLSSVPLVLRSVHRSCGLMSLRWSAS